MAHPHAKFARRLRKRLAGQFGSRAPNYRWCLTWVMRYIDELEDVSNRKKVDALYKIIQPIAKVIYDAEEGFPVSALRHLSDDGDGVFSSDASFSHRWNRRSEDADTRHRK